MLIQLRQVSKEYPSVDGAPPVAVLREVSFDLDAGQSIAVIGPSGSGKSTLLNIMGTLDRPSRGQVLLDGQDFSQLGDGPLAALRARRVGFVFQAHHLLPQLSVLENVLLPTLAAGGAAGDGASGRARRLLERVGLGRRLSHRPGELSGGERQRTAVVRALINGPGLLLADEPTGSLDRASAGELADLLIQLNREETVALVVVTHAPDLAARCQRVFELRDGRLVEAGGLA